MAADNWPGLARELAGAEARPTNQAAQGGRATFS
jgi:hypothetical protein